MEPPPFVRGLASWQKEKVVSRKLDQASDLIALSGFAFSAGIDTPAETLQESVRGFLILFLLI
jgi:hypothetical protein